MMLLLLKINLFPRCESFNINLCSVLCWGQQDLLTPIFNQFLYWGLSEAEKVLLRIGEGESDSELSGDDVEEDSSVFKEPPKWWNPPSTITDKKHCVSYGLSHQDWEPTDFFRQYTDYWVFENITIKNTHQQEVLISGFKNTSEELKISFGISMYVSYTLGSGYNWRRRWGSQL